MTIDRSIDSEILSACLSFRIELAEPIEGAIWKTQRRVGTHLILSRAHILQFFLDNHRACCTIIQLAVTPGLYPPVLCVITC